MEREGKIRGEREEEKKIVGERARNHSDCPDSSFILLFLMSMSSDPLFHERVRACEHEEAQAPTRERGEGARERKVYKLEQGRGMP